MGAPPRNAGPVPVVLGSASPRRAMLLRQVGIPFEQLVSPRISQGKQLRMAFLIAFAGGNG